MSDGLGFMSDEQRDAIDKAVQDTMPLWLVAKWQIDPRDVEDMYNEITAVRRSLHEVGHKYTIMILNEVLTHLRNYVV